MDKKEVSPVEALTTTTKNRTPDYLIQWIAWRIKKNKNVIMVINGGTGSGKSNSAIRIGHDISKKLGTSFSVKGNIAFRFSDMLDKMDMPENQKPGTVFIFEEVGAVGGGGSFREWQSKSNAFFNSFLQTCRSKNQILIMTTPSFSYLDAASRKLVHIQCDMMGINFQTKISKMKTYCLQVNSRTGKIYFKFLRVKHEGMLKKIKTYDTKIPPSNIINDYEAEKKKYQEQLNNSIRKQDKDKNEEKKTYGRKSFLKELEGIDGRTLTEVAAKLGISYDTLKRRQKEIKSKITKEYIDSHPNYKEKIVERNLIPINLSQNP